MPFNGKAKTRKGLLLPFRACDCGSCEEDQKRFREIILHRQHRLNPSTTDCRLKVNFEFAASPANALDSHSTSKTTILRLPDELLLRIFKLTRFVPTAICLALTCKRLCSLYLDTLKHRSEKIENRLWNSTNGFWKYKLIDNLIRGWIPQQSVRFCWACWLFRPYGEDSTEFWRAKIPALTAIPERGRFRVARGYCCCFQNAAHCTGRLLFSLSTMIYEEVPGLRDTSQDPIDWDEEYEYARRLRDCDDLPQYQNNWEVQFWLGEKGLAGVETSLANDKRIRCPSCVLVDNQLRLRDRGMKVVWPNGHPDPSVIVEDTLRRRASLLGYEWNPRIEFYSLTGTENLSSRMRKSRQKKRRQNAAIIETRTVSR
ncbi:hypothetical protein GJ744_004390 [Endocarpon pusillum]|uniref:F-box domain-containing protein n=1 Tax=Endocarpon pusillum TaxID=364733 RepID=A0A8H7ARC5_9EURO|nr:hypothetical protein GJ744_004390 [Endocarpon pusillum]